jgi:hypothetical protein
MGIIYVCSWWSAGNTITPKDLRFGLRAPAARSPAKCAWSLTNQSTLCRALLSAITIVLCFNFLRASGGSLEACLPSVPELFCVRLPDYHLRTARIRLLMAVSRKYHHPKRFALWSAGSCHPFSSQMRLVAHEPKYALPAHYSPP